ncbi:MAG: hypothetical protein QOJ75_2416 [Chloroflexota bacterium]|nr:hypothetical protein [Chloroflexota bacterium]
MERVRHTEWLAHANAGVHACRHADGELPASRKLRNGDADPAWDIDDPNGDNPILDPDPESESNPTNGADPGCNTEPDQRARWRGRWRDRRASWRPSARYGFIAWDGLRSIS